MKASLKELVKQRISADSEANQRARRNRCLFLAQWPDIKECLAEGWPLKIVWETMRDNGRIVCGYKTLAKHVARQKRKDAAVRPEAERESPARPARSTWGTAKPSTQSTGGQIPSFGGSRDPKDFKF